MNNQIHKLEVQYEVKSSADKFYGMLTHNAPQLPKYLPQFYHSVQLIGNGNENEITLGTIFVWNYVQDGTSVMTKEKITAVDNKNRSITYTAFEGDLANGYRSFASTLNITPKENGGSLVKWSVEYEKENEDIPTPTAFMELLETSFKELDVQLLKEQA